MEQDNKKLRLDVMVDMETVSLKENAGILSLALVPFHIDGTPCEMESYYCVIDLTSCYMAGMDMNGCQEWWAGQDALARNAVTCVDGKIPVGRAVKKAYDQLSSWGETYEVVIWSQGIDFDLPKLAWCFRTFMEKEPPYAYYNKRDARTYIKESGFDKSQIEFVGTKHHALHDAQHQVKVVQAAFSLLNKRIHFASNATEEMQEWSKSLHGEKAPEDIFDDNGNIIG